MPQLNDFTFTKAVIYVSQHDAKGALGIIINRPLALTLGKVLEHLNIEIAQPQIANHPVLMGGPSVRNMVLLFMNRNHLKERKFCFRHRKICWMTLLKIKARMIF